MTKRFYEMRGNCKGHNLDDLWGQIKKVDDIQEQAQGYAEEYAKDPKSHDNDVYFKRDMLSKVAKFDKEIKEYQNLFVDKCHEGLIVFETKDGKRLNLEESVNDNDLTMKCKVCETEIPHLKYPGWNE